MKERYWREVHNEELFSVGFTTKYYEYCNHLKKEELRPVMYMGRYGTPTGLRKESLKERDHLQPLGIDGSISNGS
jgi:hypothetical protein